MFSFIGKLEQPRLPLVTSLPQSLTFRVIQMIHRMDESDGTRPSCQLKCTGQKRFVRVWLNACEAW